MLTQKTIAIHHLRQLRRYQDRHLLTAQKPTAPSIVAQTVHNVATVVSAVLQDEAVTNAVHQDVGKNSGLYLGTYAMQATEDADLCVVHYGLAVVNMPKNTLQGRLFATCMRYEDQQTPKKDVIYPARLYRSWPHGHPGLENAEVSAQDFVQYSLDALMRSSCVSVRIQPCSSEGDTGCQD